MSKQGRGEELYASFPLAYSKSSFIFSGVTFHILGDGGQRGGQGSMTKVSRNEEEGLCVRCLLLSHYIGRSIQATEASSEGGM